MDSYVVRIYRRDGKKARILIGTAEVAGTDKRMGFSNIEELWEILQAPERTGSLRPAVSATSSTEGGDERESRVRHRGIHGGSPSNQSHLGTLKGGSR